MTGLSAGKVALQPGQAPNLPIGCLSALGVLVVWSSFIVFSRAGVTSGLTPYDVAALRFAVAGVLMAPFAYSWWPRHLSLGKVLLLSASGPSVIYSLLMYAGLRHAPAAYAGVFSNATLPILTAAYGYLLFGQKLTPIAMLGIVIILVGGGLLGLFDLGSLPERAWLGALLFLSAAAVISVYIVGVSRWGLLPRQALVVISVPNALAILPLWYFFLPSTMATAEMEVVIFQALFQGLGPSVLAVVFYALSILHLGATPTAGISAVVPATATLLAIPVLGEWPSLIQWWGVATVSLGLAMLLARRR